MHTDAVIPDEETGALSGPGLGRSVMRKSRSYIAASVTTWVKAPSGAWVMTGSEPPPSSVSTVR